MKKAELTWWGSIRHFLYLSGGVIVNNSQLFGNYYCKMGRVMIYSLIWQSVSTRRFIMVSYKPLFRYCLEHDIPMADCRKICGISPNTWTKINKNEEVSMTILNKICKGLGVTYGDIIEYIHQDESSSGEKEVQ